MGGVMVTVDSRRVRKATGLQGWERWPCQHQALQAPASSVSGLTEYDLSMVILSVHLLRAADGRPSVQDAGLEAR